MGRFRFCGASAGCPASLTTGGSCVAAARRTTLSQTRVWVDGIYTGWTVCSPGWAFEHRRGAEPDANRAQARAHRTPPEPSIGPPDRHDEVIERRQPRFDIELLSCDCSPVRSRCWASSADARPTMGGAPRCWTDEELFGHGGIHQDGGGLWRKFIGLSSFGGQTRLTLIEAFRRLGSMCPGST